MLNNNLETISSALPNEHRAIAVAAYAAPVDNQLHYLSQQGH